MFPSMGQSKKLIGPLAIGPLTAPNPVLLAPMSGVTDAPFRRQVANQGAGLVISEMTACAALASGRRNAALRVKDHGAGLHVVQLAGCEARWMADGARMAEAAGAAVVDVNMGCPAKHVTNGESGSALMRDLDHALTLIDAVVRAVKVPVTLKMRLGWDDGSRNAPELARRAEQSGVRLVTLHGPPRFPVYKRRAQGSAGTTVRAPRLSWRGVPNNPACGLSPSTAARAASFTKGAPSGRRCASSR